MINIHEILKNVGIEIPEDKKADFEKSFSENYKTVAEVQKINSKLETANTELAETKETLNKMSTEFEIFKENNSKAEDFKTKYEELLGDNERKEAARKAEREEAQERAEFDKYFSENKKEWYSPMIADGYFAKFKEAKKAEENKNKMTADILFNLTKDDGAAFKVPTPNVTLKGAEPNGNNGADDIARARAVMGLDNPKK